MSGEWESLLLDETPGAVVVTTLGGRVVFGAKAIILFLVIQKRKRRASFHECSRLWRMGRRKDKGYLHDD